MRHTLFAGSSIWVAGAIIVKIMKREHLIVAVIGNPSAAKGAGAKNSAKVLELLQQAGEGHGFTAIDLTGTSYEDSLNNARTWRDEYDYLVVVGGDGMISLGVNAVGGTDKPLGIVAMGSGNDFARGLKLPVNRLETAVEGIVGAIVCGCQVEVDLGHVTSVPGSDSTAVDTSTRDALQKPRPIDRYFAGMLSCGIDACVNDYATHSHLPGGSVRYFAGVLHEITHFKKYGYHVKVELSDGVVEEYDILSSMLTIANSRHIGGGIEISPYSRFADGMLDMVWMRYIPKLPELAKAVSRLYKGKLLSTPCFGWQRIRRVELSYSGEGAEPPILSADGEYVGTLPVEVSASPENLRLLVPPAVQKSFDQESQDAQVVAIIERDGRNPVTGNFVSEELEEAKRLDESGQFGASDESDASHKIE